MTVWELWTDEDLVQWEYTHHEVRETWDFFVDGSETPVQAQSMATGNPTTWTIGDHQFNTDAEWVRWVATPRNGHSYVNIVGWLCKDFCPTPENPEGGETIPVGEAMPWSDPATWSFANGELPKHGEDVTIPAGKHIVFDIECPAIGPENDFNAVHSVFKTIFIDGKLSFSNEADTCLHAHHVYVRGGHLMMGHVKNLHQYGIELVLHGSVDDQHVLAHNTIVAGNKALVITGTAWIFGPRISWDDQVQRAQEPLTPGMTAFKVDRALAWKAGDLLGFAPTSFSVNEYEEHKIHSYDIMTGDLVLEGNGLQYHHFGQADSTTTSHNGAEMRGEIYWLSRRIKVRATDNGWAGQVNVFDYQQPVIPPAQPFWRRGQAIFSGVEFTNFGQQDTHYAAIRFENVAGTTIDDDTCMPSRPSYVVNNVIRNSRSYGLSILNSKNIKIFDNVFWKTRQLGVNVRNSNYISILYNHVIYVETRPWTAIGEHDMNGGYHICAYGDACPNINVRDNTAIGATYAGFVAPAHDCDDFNQKKFRNNVAHSNAGIGAIIYGWKDAHATCMESSFFFAYKNQEHGIVHY